MRSGLPWKLTRAALLIAVLIGIGTNLWSNLWLTLTDREYLIPPQSSLWWFEPTHMNPGSGGWWLYGEDRDHYYHFTGEAGNPFRVISRHAARACAGFDPRQVRTWC
jgi:hypothetical protein